MRNLKATIDLSRKIITFSGPGTFLHKDRIKDLGKARWLPIEKSWEITPAKIDEEFLRASFPGLEITYANRPSLLSDLGSGDDESSERAHLEKAYSDSLKNTRTAYEGSKNEMGLLEAETSAMIVAGAPGVEVRWSVSKLLGFVQQVIVSSVPETFCVYGCLNQVKRNNGRVFMELADDENRDNYVNCSIWRGEELISAKLKRVGFELEANLQVMFVVSASMNRKGGRLSLSVSDVIAEYTVQKLAARREVTNKRLREEGLFDQNRSKKLPFLPQRLGILTSKGGTVINDFLSSLSVAEFLFELYWLPVSVQGDEARAQLLRGIEILSRREDLDAVLIFRGGGSPAELAIFNDYQVARAICLCSLPVFSAIGHQEDQSSVQDVSFRAFGVPKDIGRFFSDLVIDLRLSFEKNFKIIHERTEQLLTIREKWLGQSLRSWISLVALQVETNLKNLTRLEMEIPLRAQKIWQGSQQLLFVAVRFMTAFVSHPYEAARGNVESLRERILSRVSGNLERVDDRLKEEGRVIVAEIFRILERVQHRLQLLGRIAKDCDQLITEKSLKLSRLEGLLEAASPTVQLKRGYTIVKELNGGKVVVAAERLRAKEKIEITFWDNSVVAEVQEKLKNDSDENKVGV